jgi:hypothetical protein
MHCSWDLLLEATGTVVKSPRSKVYIDPSLPFVTKTLATSICLLHYGWVQKGWNVLSTGVTVVVSKITTSRRSFTLDAFDAVSTLVPFVWTYQQNQQSFSSVFLSQQTSEHYFQYNKPAKRTGRLFSEGQTLGERCQMSRELHRLTSRDTERPVNCHYTWE